MYIVLYYVCRLNPRATCNRATVCVTCPKWSDVIPFKVYADNEWREFHSKK